MYYLGHWDCCAFSLVKAKQTSLGDRWRRHADIVAPTAVVTQLCRKFMLSLILTAFRSGSCAWTTASLARTLTPPCTPRNPIGVRRISGRTRQVTRTHGGDTLR